MNSIKSQVLNGIVEKWSNQIFNIRLPYQNGTWKFALQSEVSGEAFVTATVDFGDSWRGTAFAESSAVATAVNASDIYAIREKMLRVKFRARFNST